jgi:hypothetical protein
LRASNQKLEGETRVFMRRGVVCFVLLLGCGTANAGPRCGPVLLRIRGEAKVESPKQQIQVTIAPEPKRSNPLILIEEQRFEADVFYDSLKSHGGVVGYNCDARPEKVTVSLVENGREIDKRQLLFNKDFVLDGDGGYVLRTKLHLGK